MEMKTAWYLYHHLEVLKFRITSPPAVLLDTPGHGRFEDITAPLTAVDRRPDAIDAAKACCEDRSLVFMEATRLRVIRRS